jgi:competence protein ComEC
MKKQQIYTAEIFFVRALLPYVIGIACVWFYGNATWLYGVGLLTAITTAVMLFLQSFYHLFQLYNHKGITGLTAALFLCSCGGLNAMLQQYSYRQDHFANCRHEFLKIRIIEDPQMKSGLLRFKAAVTKGYSKSGRQEVLSGNLLVYLMEPDTNILNRYTYGTEMIVPSKYRPTEPPVNPGEFDYQFWLSTQNINHQSFINYTQVALLPGNNGNRLIKFALDLRSRQISYYQNLLKDKEAFALASTLILGSRADLSTETLDIYSKTGTIHALSVSGMHVGLIYLVVSWMLQFLKRKKSLAILQLLLILGLVWLYALVTGFSASVLRSAIMLSTFLIAKTFSKQSNSYNILAFAAFCLLVYNPLYLFDVGSQLSFLAVLGLVYLQPKLQYGIDLKSKLLQKIWGLVAISLAAQIATFPLSIYYFHQFPVHFIISNLFITLPIALLLYMGLLILLLKLDFLATFFEKIIGLTNAGLQWLSELPFSSISGIWINKAELIFLSLTVVMWCLAVGSRNKKLLMAGLFCMLVYQGMTSLDQLEAAHQQKTIDFKLRGYRAKAYLKGYAALIVTDLKPGEKRYRYSIQPVLDFHHIRKIRIIHPDTVEAKK